MNDLQIFNNEEFGQIRTVTINNEPWFVGKDVAIALGYKNTKDALATHVENCDKIMGSQNATPSIKDSMGREQRPTWINESGLYALIFGSKLDSAKRFKHWVTSEVLPSIRKNGNYQMMQHESSELSPQLQMLQGLLDQMKETEIANKKRDRQIALAQETAEKAVEATERMKDEIISPFDNWRDDINKKVRQISIASGIPYQGLFTSIYSDLEHIGRCDLSTRQRNKRDRMERAGCTKTDIQKETTKIAVIEDDARLKQIFEDIVRKYGMKYLA